MWLPLHVFATEPHIASFIWRQGPARRHDFTCSQLSSGEWLFFGNFNECKIVLGENSEIDNCEMVIKIEFRTWNHHNRPKSLSKQLIWRETKLFECRLSANQQWNVFLSVSAIMMISIPCASSDNAPTNKICRRAPLAWLWTERLRTRSCHERESLVSNFKFFFLIELLKHLFFMSCGLIEQDKRRSRIRGELVEFGALKVTCVLVSLACPISSDVLTNAKRSKESLDRGSEVNLSSLEH